MNIYFDRVTQSASSGKIPWKMAGKGFTNLKNLHSSVELIEKHSEIPYPDIIVVPELKILIHEAQIQSVVHANIDFKRWDYRITPVISISLTLLVFGKKTQYSAVLMHELLHYLYLSTKFLDRNFFSLDLKIGDTATGRLVFDELEQVSPKKVVKSPYLVNLVTKKFRSLVDDKRFISTIEEKWMKRDLPTITLRPKDFAVRISPSDFVNLYFPEKVLNKARRLTP